MSRRPSLMILALLVALAGGAAAGYTAALCRNQDRASTLAPEGWSRVRAMVPYRRPELLGELSLEPGAWSMDHFESMRAAEPSQHLSLTARLPSGGSLFLFPAAAGRGLPHGAALSLRRGTAPAAGAVIINDKGAEHPLSCEGSLPAPTDAPYTISLERAPGGFTATAGSDTLRCLTAEVRGGPAVRGGLQRVLLSDITTDSGTAPPPILRETLRTGAAAGAASAAALVACELALGAGPLGVALTTLPLLICLLTAGRDGAVAVDALRLGLLDGRWLPVLAGAAPAAALKVLHHAWRLSRPVRGGSGEGPLPKDPRLWWRAAAAWLPAGLAVALTPGSAPRAVGLALAVLAAPLLAAGTGLLQRRLSGFGGPTLIRSSAAVGLCASAAAAAAWLAGATYRGAPLYIGAAGAAAGLVVWANANPARVARYNLLSLAMVTLGLIGLDYGLRFTSLSSSWSAVGMAASADDELGWVPSTWAQFDAIAQGQHTEYPSEGYPVAVPEKTAPIRIVAMGGSSTGGAFQNDDINQFYPARLEELLAPRVEVLNQGVGSWTTLHIREYARRVMGDLQADIVTAYVGHNDQFTDLPLPQKELYAAWRAGGASRRTAGLLRRSLLYNGLRYGLSNLRSTQSVAVPVEHARENLMELAEITRAHGAKLLLMSEGLNPDPGALTPYWAMMQDIARDREDVAWLDTAWLLHQRGDAMFLDDCHLSDMGHRTLAAEIAAELERLGWLED